MTFIKKNGQNRRKDDYGENKTNIINNVGMLYKFTSRHIMTDISYVHYVLFATFSARQKYVCNKTLYVLPTFASPWKKDH